MSEQHQAEDMSILERLPTGISGLDAILGGGLPARRSCLIAGTPGTGKTTLGNQIAYAHAARGGRVVFATLLTESHEVLIENLRSFRFFDPAIVGGDVRYLSLLTSLLEGGLDATIDMLRREVRQMNATVLIIDGTAVVGDVATSAFDLRQFVQRLEVQFSLLGCTTILLTSHTGKEMRLLGGHVNGVILLTNDLIGHRHLRLLEIVKMRGVRHIGGRHEFTIEDEGIGVFPRLESLAGQHRSARTVSHGLGIGVPALDTMLGGGLMPLSTTVVVGTPGAGKTILGLSFLVEGAEHGERGLIAGFQETTEDLCATAEGIGLDLQKHIESGRIRVMRTAPLELSADVWAWHLLEEVEEQAPQRIFIDALTDVQRVITLPSRSSPFVAALCHELRSHGATILVSVAIETYPDDNLTVPVPAISAAMDIGILLRRMEVGGYLRRLVSVLKVRQSASDPAVREMAITDTGIVVTGPFKTTSGLLSGRVSAGPSADGDAMP